MIKKTLKYIFITVFIGSLPAFFINFKNYEDIIKPPLSPPGFLFPIVWTILFILMGISIARVMDKTDDKSLLILYFTQLIINALWTPIFFGLKAYLFAFIWILILLGLVIYLTIRFYHIDKVSSYLLIPYIIWLVFAGYLNLGVYILN